MAITTYAELLAAIPDWITRSDATESLCASWVSLAEARINRILRVNAMLTRSTASISDEYGTVPSDYMGAQTMRLTAAPYTYLAYITPEQMSAYKATNPTGDLVAFTQVGSEFWFAPTPSTAVTVELIYYARIPALNSTTQTTNWLLTSHPDVYLRGALLEASLYFEDDEAANKWSALFSDALSNVKDADQRDVMAANASPVPSMTVI